MNLRRGFFYVLLIVGLLQAETLEQTVVAALKNSEHYQSVVALQRQAIELQHAVQRKYLPLLKYDYSYKHVSEITSVKTPFMNLDMGVKDNYDNGLTISWLVFDGLARESRLTAAEIEVSLADNVLQRVQREVAFGTAQLYVSIVQLQIQQEELLVDKARVAAQRQRVQALVDQGQAIPLDLLSLDLQLNEYTQQLLVLKNQEITLQDSLQDSVGTVQVVTFSPTIREELPVLVLEMIPDWQELSLRERLSTVNSVLVAASMYPEVTLSGSTRRGKPGINPIDNEWLSYQTAGVGLQWLLWDWGSRFADVLAQAAATEAIRFQQAELKKKIITKQKTICREYSTLQQQLQLYSVAKNLAKKRAEIFAARYAQGLVSTTDYIQAQQDFSAACLQVVSCQYAVYLKAIELDYCSGKAIQVWRLS